MLVGVLLVVILFCFSSMMWLVWFVVRFRLCNIMIMYVLVLVRVCMLCSVCFWWCRFSVVVGLFKSSNGVCWVRMCVKVVCVDLLFDNCCILCRWRVCSLVVLMVCFICVLFIMGFGGCGKCFIVIIFLMLKVNCMLCFCGIIVCLWVNVFVV